MLSAPSTIANRDRHHLAPRVRGTRPVTPQPHRPSCQRLDPKPVGERRDQRHPSVRNSPLVVEFDPQTVQSDRLVIMHHEGDLLSAGPGCSIQPLKPCTGGHSSFHAGRNRPTDPVDPGLVTFGVFRRLGLEIDDPLTSSQAFGCSRSPAS
jgi:hypothetical protein